MCSLPIPSLPHFPLQSAVRAQQLGWPFGFTPHLEHLVGLAALDAVVVVVIVLVLIAVIAVIVVIPIIVVISVVVVVVAAASIMPVNTCTTLYVEGVQIECNIDQHIESGSNSEMTALQQTTMYQTAHVLSCNKWTAYLHMHRPVGPHSNCARNFRLHSHTALSMRHRRRNNLGSHSD